MRPGLDVDDRDGEGPETITTQLIPSTVGLSICTIVLLAIALARFRKKLA